MSRAKDKWVCTYHAAIFAVINYLQRIDSCTLRSENIKYEIYNKTVAKILIMLRLAVRFWKCIIYRNTKMSRISKQTLHLKSSNLFKCKQILMLTFVIKFIAFIKGITNDHVGSGQTEGDKIKATKN